MLAAAGEKTFKKDKRFNIRLSSHDLVGIQRKAARKGIPYQALISGLIHQYVEGAIDNGYPVLHMPQGLEGWRAWMEARGLPSTLPDATDIRLEEVVVVPELTEIFRQQMAPMRQQLEEQNRFNASMGLTLRTTMDVIAMAARCRFQEKGREWEQLFVFVTGHTTNESEFGRQIFWFIEPNYGFRAAAGELDATLPLLVTIANSVQPTPEWAGMRDDHLRKMNQIAARGAAERSAIMADANRDINRMLTEGWEGRQASQERGHRQFINAIRGVDNYAVPGSSTPVQLPNTHRHVYTNQQGEYLLFDDPNFDPNRDPVLQDSRWTEMKPVK